MHAVLLTQQKPNSYMKNPNELSAASSLRGDELQLNYEFDRQLELERADAIEEGMEIGIEKGIEKGANKMLFTLVTKGKLDIDTAAEEAGVSVSEFEKLMSEAGYKVPETV